MPEPEIDGSPSTVVADSSPAACAMQHAATWRPGALWGNHETRAGHWAMAGVVTVDAVCTPVDVYCHNAERTGWH